MGVLFSFLRIFSATEFSPLEGWKDPEFYQYLQEHGNDLLNFEVEDEDDDIDFDDDVDVDMDDAETQSGDGAAAHEEEEQGEEKPYSKNDAETQSGDGAAAHEEEEQEEEKPYSKNVITSAMVDSWCNSIREDGKLSAVRSLMRAFRTACHYGDDTAAGNDPSAKFSVMSSTVFNKVMLFTLLEMDRVLRQLMKLPASGGKRETINELMSTKQWKSYNLLLKSYLGNALHVLNQMTDTEMISFTLNRLQCSSVFLAAFPSLLRKYIKVALHFWGTGSGALPDVSFLFLKDLCVSLGSDCLDDCCRGIYKAYVLNCHFVNAVKLQHIQFLANCVIELIRVDLPTAYQHAFVFIRQLSMLLRDALNMKTKESFRKVYEWKFINCLELWTEAVCAYSSDADFNPLAYPLTQIIYGVARLVPTARYFPLRLRPPTGGVGKAVDLHTTLKVSKPILKTRSFQEACLISVVQELAQHLAQWSSSVAFFELSFIPAVRLRSLCKSTKVERFRKQMRHLIRQIEANVEFTNKKRGSVTFLPDDHAATTFLEDEKKMGTSPLSKYVVTLCQRAQQRNDSIMEPSVLVGEKSAVFGSKVVSRLPGGDSSAKLIPREEEEEKENKKKKKGKSEDGEDIVEDLVLSSDEDEPLSDSQSTEEDDSEEEQSKKQKPKNLLKKNARIFHANKSNKRKRAG
ncbi:Nucleolar complex protein 2 [Corchorus capsularis]|uniref:Nucleolar complex protein 2 n=1 Tax=Corchorus capsularis TaxID=210143 RepID=A0A1R3HVQ6_COCAP|nr:Nucleolar complex protein 2 [Corchorus capsularis]